MYWCQQLWVLVLLLLMFLQFLKQNHRHKLFSLSSMTKVRSTWEMDKMQLFKKFNLEKFNLLMLISNTPLATFKFLIILTWRFQQVLRLHWLVPQAAVNRPLQIYFWDSTMFKADKSWLMVTISDRTMFRTYVGKLDLWCKSQSYLTSQ